MMMSTVFKSVRKLLGDTFVPYRNSDADLVDGLTSCIEALFLFDPDLFLNDLLEVVNEYSEATSRQDEKMYYVGDIIYVNDPLQLYICSVEGVSADIEPNYDSLTETDGTASFSLWEPPEAINRNAMLHYITYFCLMMDNDEQANGPLADKHYALYEGAR